MQPHPLDQLDKDLRELLADAEQIEAKLASGEALTDPHTRAHLVEEIRLIKLYFALRAQD
jgi:hypothetical protein